MLKRRPAEGTGGYSTIARSGPIKCGGFGSTAAKAAERVSAAITVKAARSKSTMEDEADVLFSLLVRERDGYQCRDCNYDGTYHKSWMECAHVVGRRFKAVRWDFDSAICLCHTCHVHYTSRLPEWKAFLLTKGIDYDLKLHEGRHGPVPNVADVLSSLKAVARG